MGSGEAVRSRFLQTLTFYCSKPRVHFFPHFFNSKIPKHKTQTDGTENRLSFTPDYLFISQSHNEERKQKIKEP